MRGIGGAQLCGCPLDQMIGGFAHANRHAAGA
jgi:hypothetical protein